MCGIQNKAHEKQWENNFFGRKYLQNEIHGHEDREKKRPVKMEKMKKKMPKEEYN